MTQKLKDESEKVAWDTYAAAALELAHKNVSQTTPGRHTDNLAKFAADLADSLLTERRKRISQQG